VPFAPGDRVHLPGLGTGMVREVRSGDRYVIEIKGRTMVVGGAQMERAAPAPSSSRRRPAANSDHPYEQQDAATGRAMHTPVSLDLHGKTVEEAIGALDEFLNEALIASHAEVRVIHGRSGGRIRDAVHRRLRELGPVRSFRIDPRNAGVTIVTL
jgi:dsDNA-specific endonuclease/ATPase MutS2